MSSGKYFLNNFPAYLNTTKLAPFQSWCGRETIALIARIWQIAHPVAGKDFAGQNQQNRFLQKSDFMLKIFRFCEQYF